MFVARNRNLIMTTDRDDHKKKSKVIGAVLNERSMRIFQPKMIKRINEFLQQILNSTSQKSVCVNMLDISTYLATDVAGDLAFGHPLDTQTSKTNRFLPATLHNWSWRINVMMQFPPLRIYNLLMMTLRFKETKKLAVAIKDIVREREAMDRHAYHDFYSVVIDEIQLGESFLSSEMWPHGTSFLAAGTWFLLKGDFAANVNIFMAIGGLTSAATIAGTFFYLSRYPECYARLASEIRTTFSTGDEIQQGPKLASCKYLRACIEESLRCSPPVLTILWRQLDPADNSDKPFMVDGHVIPRGTQVGVSLYSLFHNEAIYPDPFVYQPERWLEPEDKISEDEKAARQVMRMAHIPFATGDRVCPGRAMAWIEMSITIARTFWYFDFQKAPGKLGDVGEILHPRPDGRGFIPDYETEDYFAAGHHGPYLTFSKRGSFTKELEEALQEI